MRGGLVLLRIDIPLLRVQITIIGVELTLFRVGIIIFRLGIALFRGGTHTILEIKSTNQPSWSQNKSNYGLKSNQT